MKNRYDELRRATWSLPDGKQKLAVMEEMILIADRYMTEEDAYDIRMDYLSAAIEAGCPEKMLVVFSWCVSKFEKNPGTYAHHMLIWCYKWVLNELWQMPEFSLTQIERIYADFKEKCLQFGYSLRPYYQQKINLLLSQGLQAEAAAYYKKWRAAPRDSLADCKACEQNLFGKYHFQVGYPKKGLQALKPILDGRMRCRSIPQNTYAQIILPLLKVKDYEQAIAAAKKSIHLLDGPMYLEEFGLFLAFYTVTDLAKAEKLYNRTVHLALESKNGWIRLHYWMAVRQFLREWHRKRRRKKLAAADVVTLDWLDGEIASLTAAFNRRNGNDYVSHIVAENDKTAGKLLREYAAAQ